MKVFIDCQLSIGYANANRADKVEVFFEDDATPEEIAAAKDEAAREWAFNYLEWDWSDVKK